MNRFVNNQGKVDTNIELDREMEHHNRNFKEECTHFRGKVTAASIHRVSHAAQSLETILKNCDKSCKVRGQSGVHTSKDNSEDVAKLALHFSKNEIFRNIPPRHHFAFPSFQINPLMQLDLMSFQEWLIKKVKELIQRESPA